VNPRSAELIEIIRGEAWLLGVLDRAREEHLPDWFVGAGAILDVVWDTRFGNGFDRSLVKDVDLVYFDPTDLSKDAERAIEARLGPAWDVTNQAAVHTWFHTKFGGDPVEPLTSSEAGIATWPERATCVGARLEDDDTITIAAPHGLDDLLDGVWRSNPVRVSPEEARRRFDRKQVGKRWPSVRVV
jgi:hypothetical protein